MVKSMYSYVAEFWRNRDSPEFIELSKKRIIQWRREGALQRIERPTRIDRARSLGYRAKPGYIIVRSRVRKGGRRKKRPVRGRKSRNLGVNKITPKKSIKLIAEERANRKYSNLEVLNSYFVGQDGTHKWFEIIFVDPQHPVIAKDPRINWISTYEYRGDKKYYLKNPKHKGRVYRGKTRAGKKMRGQTTKRKGTEKNRPSLRAHGRRGN